MRLLLVEDSARLRELLRQRVHDAGWRIDCVDSVAAARDVVTRVDYNLALIDLGLPDGDGVALIKDLRGQGLSLPILVITARGSIEDRVSALDSGADDYLVKPFNHIELLARCRALLRRRLLPTMEIVEVAGLSYDVSTGAIAVAGDVLSISPRERSLLEILMRNLGRVVTKQAIETALSEFGDEISTNAVELAVSRLRRRLQPFEIAADIETIRGIGYLLREKTGKLPI